LADQMTVMDKKDSNIEQFAMGIAAFVIPLSFAICMVKWPDYPKDGTWLGNLYYVCTASTLYVMSVIFYMMAQKFWVKITTAFCMAIFAVNLYVEIYLNPTNWSNWSLLLLLVVTGNTLLMVFIIEKLKSKWGKRKP